MQRDVQFGQRGRLGGEGSGRRELEGVVAVGAFDVADPDGSVDRRAQDRAVAAGDGCAGGGLAQFVGRSGVGIEEVAGRAEQRIGDAGEAVGGAEFLQDGSCAVSRPVDRAVELS